MRKVIVIYQQNIVDLGLKDELDLTDASVMSDIALQHNEHCEAPDEIIPYPLRNALLRNPLWNQNRSWLSRRISVLVEKGLLFRKLHGQSYWVQMTEKGWQIIHGREPGK